MPEEVYTLIKVLVAFVIFLGIMLKINENEDD